MSSSRKNFPGLLNETADRGAEQKKSLLGSFVPGMDDQTYGELQKSVSHLLDIEETENMQKTFLLEKTLNDRLKERSKGKKKGFETIIMNEAIRLYLDAMDREDEKRNNS